MTFWIYIWLQSVVKVRQILKTEKNQTWVFCNFFFFLEIRRDYSGWNFNEVLVKFRVTNDVLIAIFSFWAKIKIVFTASCDELFWKSPSRINIMGSVFLKNRYMLQRFYQFIKFEPSKSKGWNKKILVPLELSHQEFDSFLKNLERHFRTLFAMHDH